jgi:hypothetical protein
LPLVFPVLPILQLFLSFEICEKKDHIPLLLPTTTVLGQCSTVCCIIAHTGNTAQQQTHKFVGMEKQKKLKN